MPPTYIAPEPWNKQELKWAKNFDIVELGSFEEIDSIKIKPFKKILTYQWLPAFYEGNPSPFDLWAMKKGYILNPKQAGLHEKGDRYYDLCQEELVQKRVEYLVKECNKRGLYGIFFDWGNEEFLHEPEFRSIKKRLHSLHPKKRYADCIASFYSKLQKRGIAVISNQAFRNPTLLDAVDYDMSESYISSYERIKKKTWIDGKRVNYLPYTDYFPTGKSIEDTFYHLQRLDELVKKHKVKNMIYMNYAAPLLHPTSKGYRSSQPKEVIHFNFAFAKLFDAICYTEIPYDRSLEQDPIYFIDLGKPTTPIKHYPKTYIRGFEKGFVLVSDKEITLHIKRRSFDTFTNRWIEPGTYKIKRSYDTITKNYIPIGRVFLYER